MLEIVVFERGGGEMGVTFSANFRRKGASKSPT